MSEGRAEAITARLVELLRGDFGGGADAALVNEVRQLVTELRPLLEGSLGSRASSLLYYVEMACSPRRWRKHGLDRVQDFAREDAYVLHTHV